MQFYLSSYLLGDNPERLLELAPGDAIGFIPNALDFKEVSPERRQAHLERDMDSLSAIGFSAELLDLRDYFNNKNALQAKLDELGAVFVSGGNTFILRQAMMLSGLDNLLNDLLATNFLYAGYSAGGCVLAPNFLAYQTVDHPETPYPECREVIWEGLGFTDFVFMPHWDSDHPESADIDKEIAFCEENAIPYRAVRDGDVLIFER